MEVKYDISQYIASVKMSRKSRILVEGKDDKSHVRNLLLTVLGRNKIKVDTADLIKGDCGVTSKNNRAKIDKIHNYCNNSEGYENLYFLCDREFSKFNISNVIEDLMRDHEREGNLCWTSGHSFENYFIERQVIPEAYRYLTGSEYKADAVYLFSEILPESINIISSISLAAKDIGKSTYPGGVIRWDDFKIVDRNLFFSIDEWRIGDSSQIKKEFSEAYKKYYPIARSSEETICARICRGHTAMQMLQRIFAACLHQAGLDNSSELSAKHAEDFSRLRESSLSSALCEAWLQSIKNGNKNYPANLVSSVA